MTIAASANLGAIVNGAVPDASKVNGELAHIESRAFDASNTSSDTIQGATNYALTAGSSSAYTLTLVPAHTAYRDGQVLTVRPHAANAAGATINVNGLGARTIYDTRGVALKASMLITGHPYLLIYNSTLAGFVCASVPGLMMFGQFQRGVVSGRNTGGTITVTTTATQIAQTGNITVNVGDIFLVQVALQIRKLTTQGHITYAVNVVNSSGPLVETDITIGDGSGFTDYSKTLRDVEVGGYRLEMPLYQCQIVAGTGGVVYLELVALTSVATADVAINEGSLIARLLANG